MSHPQPTPHTGRRSQSSRRQSGRIWTLLLLASCLLVPGPGRAAEAEPQRIVALAPNVVELLFELGLGDRVRGVGDYCHWPPEVEALPRLGGLVDPHLERILGLGPDLVVALESEERLATGMEQLGVPVLRLHIETAAEVAEAARKIGEATGRNEVAEAFAHGFLAHLGSRRVAGEPSVAVVFGREAGTLGQLMTTGEDTYVTELLTHLGARNLFTDAIGRYPRIGLEEILRRDPDWIVELQWEERDARGRDLLLDDWRRFSTLRAVQEGRIGVLDGGYTVIPGPRLRQLYDALADLLGAEPVPPPPP